MSGLENACQHTLHSTFITAEEVTGGEIKVNIKYDSIIPYDKTVDICDVLKTVNLSCPIKPVQSRFTISEEIPSDVPGVSQRVT